MRVANKTSKPPSTRARRKSRKSRKSRTSRLRRKSRSAGDRTADERTAAAALVTLQRANQGGVNGGGTSGGSGSASASGGGGGWSESNDDDFYDQYIRTWTGAVFETSNLLTEYSKYRLYTDKVNLLKSIPPSNPSAKSFETHVYVSKLLYNKNIFPVNVHNIQVITNGNVTNVTHEHFLMYIHMTNSYLFFPTNMLTTAGFDLNTDHIYAVFDYAQNSFFTEILTYQLQQWQSPQNNFMLQNLLKLLWLGANHEIDNTRELQLKCVGHYYPEDNAQLAMFDVGYDSGDNEYYTIDNEGIFQIRIRNHTKTGYKSSTWSLLSSHETVGLVQFGNRKDYIVPPRLTPRFRYRNTLPHENQKVPSIVREWPSPSPASDYWKETSRIRNKDIEPYVLSVGQFVVYITKQGNHVAARISYVHPTSPTSYTLVIFDNTNLRRVNAVTYVNVQETRKENDHQYTECCYHLRKPVVVKQARSHGQTWYRTNYLCGNWFLTLADLQKKLLNPVYGIHSMDHYDDDTGTMVDAPAWPDPPVMGT